MRTRTILRMIGTAVLVAGLGLSTAQGVTIEGGEVNISGASLFFDFFKAPASTNDFIDADGDGRFGFNESGSGGWFVDQLAEEWEPATTWWAVQYRGVGSGNGLAEFVSYVLNGTIPTAPTTEGWLINRSVQPAAGPPAYWQTTVDMAVMDVPTTWFVQTGAAVNAAWNRKPLEDGYGQNPRTAWDASTSNKLKTLCSGGNCLNLNIASPDDRTVYDTEIAYVPVAIIANRGTGVENIKYTEMQHLWVTGRMPNGENLVAATRDVGSGTRNACMNSLGIDPSWGRGDNLGVKTDDTSAWRSNLGEGHQATNCGGSSIIEAAVEMRRLAIGYTGLGGTSRAAGDAISGKYEILNVMKDIDADGDGLPDANTYVRPSVDSVCDNLNPNTGYQIGGSETFATRGDPLDTDPSHVQYMANQHAADYLRNILASIAGFAGDPPAALNYNMPGEYLAYTFFLTASLDANPSKTNPVLYQPTVGFNQNLQDFVKVNNGLGVGSPTLPPYGSVNPAGKTPKRNAKTPPATYLDGSVDGTYVYKLSNGTFASPNLASGLKLGERNRIQGDFNRDGLRNADDINAMMEAFTNPIEFEQVDGLYSSRVPSGGWPGAKGQQLENVVIVHLIGDFDGNGDFDADDVRYFADGLAISTTSGKLDRKAGFIAVDTAWATLPGGDVNFFNTVLATPKAYAAGDARGDVAGRTPWPGAQPHGWDGVVNCADIDYVYSNFGTWSSLAEAARIDLSCDMNGDLTVNQADIDELVQVILGTSYGDADLDGDVDAADLAICEGNQGQTGGWCAGDFSGNGVVGPEDLAYFQSGSPADFDSDGDVDVSDFSFFQRCFNGPGNPPASPDCGEADFDGDHDVDVSDFATFQSCFNGPSRPASC